MFPSKSLLLGAVLAAAAALPAAALTPLPPARWTPEQRHEVLALTRTLRLAPDLSALGPGEQAALKELLAAGELVQQVYEVQVHPQARQALAQIRALPPGQERDEFLQLYRLFKGPIGTTPANAREAFWNVSPVTPAKGVYPGDLTRAELDAYLAAHPQEADALKNPLSVVRRATREDLERDLARFKAFPVLDTLHPGLRARLQALQPDPKRLYALPYSLAFARETMAIYGHLQAAASAVQAEDAQFAGYLRARARDLLADDYEAGDAAWVTARFQHLNAQIGAYETYDDELLGVRAFWSMSIQLRRAAESDAVAGALGGLQAIHDALPVKVARKVRSDLPVGVYDVVADFGQARGGNTATILPNDAEHARRYGRIIMLRDNIISHPETVAQADAAWRAAIVPAQHGDHTAASAVQRTLWHEIGHYLGVDRTRDGRDLDAALQDSADLYEELKSDLVALQAIPQLRAAGYYTPAQAQAVYADGISRVLQRVKPRRDQPYNTMQLMTWNWFLDKGVLRFEPATGQLRIDYAKYPAAVDELLAKVLELQAAGDRDRAEAFVTEWTRWDPALHEVIAQKIRASLQFRYAIYTYAGESADEVP
jgi:hypothetical protein